MSGRPELTDPELAAEGVDLHDVGVSVASVAAAEITHGVSCDVDEPIVINAHPAGGVDGSSAHLLDPG